MPAVLTADVQLMCTVGSGTIKPAGKGKLVISGSNILTQTDLEGASVSDCKPPSPPPQSPCTTVGKIVGLATKLSVGGAFVCLDQMTASSTPGPHPVGPASATQTKLVTS